MKTNIMRFAFLGIIVFLIQPGFAETILLDYGWAVAPDPVDDFGRTWNTGMTAAGTDWNLKNINGDVTDVDVGWPDSFGGGVQGNGLDPSPITTYPGFATNDSYYEAQDGSAQCKIRTLDPDLEYKLKFYGSRGVTGDDRNLTVTVNNIVQTYNAGGTAGEGQVTFTGIKPNAQGEIWVDFSMPSGNGHLGTLQITTNERAGFGKQWVRSHDFHVSALVAREADLDLGTYDDLNVTQAFAWSNSPELAVALYNQGEGRLWFGHGYGYELTPSVKNVINNAFGEYYSANGVGWCASDEPGLEDMAGVGRIVKWTNETYPDKLVYSNTYITTPEYLKSFVDLIEPDVLHWDDYPFKADGSTNPNYYKEMMAIRNRAQASNIPYWTYIQAFKDGPDYPGYPVWRTPSESDIRMQVYSCLTAGFTGITYFSYSGSNHATIDCTLVDENDNTTALYDDVADLNAEINNLGAVLRFLESTHVLFVPGMLNSTTENTTPAGLSDWSADDDGDPHITDVRVGVNYGVGKDGLIGFFTDDDGEKYFMLTNLYHMANASSAAKGLPFIIEFDSSIDELLLLNSETGQEQIIYLTDHTLNVFLNGGTGNLYKYNVGSFPTPEPCSIFILLLIGVPMVLRRRK